MNYTNDQQTDCYQSWQSAQKVPIHRGFFVEDLNKAEVAPWESKGGAGSTADLHCDSGK